MASVLKRLNVEPEAKAPPRTRKVTRVQSNAMATISAMGGGGVRVRLGDISTHGCLIRGAVDWLRTGSFVTLRLGRDRPVQGIVRWLREDAAGVELLRPLTDTHPEWIALIHHDDLW